jgi:8-amino-7-oxononanoate synthase
MPLSDAKNAQCELQTVLKARLQQREHAGLLRKRLQRSSAQRPLQTVDGRQLLSFCSNDYLGLANHPRVIAAFQDGADRYGVGSGASHLVSGHCTAHQQLEEELAAFLGRDRALLFSTGYMANTGTINALMQAGGLVLQDELNHVSLLEGGWLSRAESVRFPHRDVASVQRLLDRASADHTLVVTDGIFSMDGDAAPVQELAAICRKKGAWLMVDDAHGLGCTGTGGLGTIESQGRFLDQNDVPVLVGTLGKAFGTAGAFVAGSETLIEYLQQFARSYVFTTALPPAIAEASRESLRLIQSETWRREKLQWLIGRFRSETLRMGLPLLDSLTPIQALVTGDVPSTLTASAILRQHDLHVSAIRPPTVPVGGARLRITLSAAHTEEDLDRLLQGLQSVKQHLQLTAA